MTDPTDLPTLKARLRELRAKSTIRSGGFLTREAERAEEQLRDLLHSSLPTLLDALDATERATATPATPDQIQELRRLHEAAALGPLRVTKLDNEAGDISWQVQQAEPPHEVLATILECDFPRPKAVATLVAKALDVLPALLDLAEGAAGHVTEEQLRAALERAWDCGNDAWDSRGMDDEIEERRGIDVAMLLAELNPRSPWRPITQECVHGCGVRLLPFEAGTLLDAVLRASDPDCDSIVDGVHRDARVALKGGRR